MLAVPSTGDTVGGASGTETTLNVYVDAAGSGTGVASSDIRPVVKVNV